MSREPDAESAPRVPSPAELVGRCLPDVVLAAADGRAFPLRDATRAGPLVLFFFIRNGTPG